MAPELVVIEPLSGLRRLGLGDLWRSREIVRALTVRDIKLRYRQTLLGAVWVLFQPLVGAGIFTLVFSRIAGLTSGDVPYWLFAFAGMCAWIPVGWTLDRAAPSLIHNASLVSRLWFPRIVIPAGGVGSVGVDAAVAFTAVLVATWLSGAGGAASVLALFWLVPLFLLGFSIGLFAATLMVRWRDLRYVIPPTMQFVLWASPVGYPSDRLSGTAQTIYNLNPLAALIEGFRATLFGLAMPSASRIAYSLCWVVVAGVVALVVFRAREGTFADFI